MRKPIYEIDENGFVVEIYVANFDEDGNPVEELAGEMILVLQPDGLYHPKWTGEEWVEGATQDEIEEMTKPEPQPPSIIDKLRMEQAQANAELIELIFGMSGGGV